MSGSDNINSYSVIVRTNRRCAKADGKKLPPFVVGLTVVSGDFHQRMITFSYSAGLFLKLEVFQDVSCLRNNDVGPIHPNAYQPAFHEVFNSFGL